MDYDDCDNDYDNDYDGDCDYYIDIEGHAIYYDD